MDLARFQQFSRHDHILMLASELKRAVPWEHSNPSLYEATLDRCIKLSSFMLEDPQWHTILPLARAMHEAFSQYRSGEKKNLAYLYRVL